MSENSIKPLGRGAEISEVVQKENENFSDYKNALKNAGAANTPENGRKHRKAFLDYLNREPEKNKDMIKKVRGIFKALDMDI